jgi:hypothetical protein
MLSLAEIVADFARALAAADERRPVYVSRSGRAYQPGIGPHAEDMAVELVLTEMRARAPGRYEHSGRGLLYPRSKQKADLWIGRPLEWIVEAKMARFFGDNGKPDDTAIKDLLSPYDHHRSALTDCRKLRGSGFDCRRAILVYGFEHASLALEPAVSAFEVLARSAGRLGDRIAADAGRLIHPVFSRGVVFAWEIEPPT